MRYAYIYMGICFDTQKYYIGSTWDFEDRVRQHEFRYTNYINFDDDYYCGSFEIMENNNYDFIIIDEGYFEDLQDRKNKESEYIDLDDKFCVNKNKPFILTEKVDDWNKEYKKHYNSNNKDIINEKAREYKKENRAIINEKAKIYYQNNKEIISEKTKEYRAKNKEMISNRKKEIVICDNCGKQSTRCHLARHKKTDYCRSYNSLLVPS